jgi:hypothetical protein
MNDFVKGFNQDLGRAVQIASTRTLISLEEYVASKGAFLSDTETLFIESVQNGTIEGTPVELMNDSSINDYLLKVRRISNNLNLNMTANVTDIRLYHSDPWTIYVEVDLTVKIDDKGEVAHWGYNYTSISKVSIINLRDPVYSVFTYNRFPNTIRPSNYSYLVSPSNNTDNLSEHIYNGYYLASTAAPSFLMRFENDNTSDPNGIESIVDIEGLRIQKLGVFEDRIKVDYIYFNDLPGIKACEFTGVTPDVYFIITNDTYRLELYNVSDLNPLSGSACDS